MLLRKRPALGERTWESVLVSDSLIWKGALTVIDGQSCPICNLPAYFESRIATMCLDRYTTLSVNSLVDELRAFSPGSSVPGLDNIESLPIPSH